MMKGKLLTLTVALLAAACLLMVAGGLPYGGEPRVLRGGVMVVIGAVGAVICAVAAGYKAFGHLWRLVAGLLSIMFCVAGAVAAWNFFSKAAEFVRIGGLMVFGAAGMACLGIVGVLFVVIFGYLAVLAMRRGLWTAGMHAAVAIILMGVYVDYALSERRDVVCPVRVTSPSERGAAHPLDLPFRLDVRRVEVERYDTPESYAVMKHKNGQFKLIGEATREGDTLRFGGEIWRLDGRESGVRPLLFGEGEEMRVLVRREAPVREYRAYCVVGEEGGATREELLRVNHPVACGGWLIYLMDCTPEGDEVRLLVRRAPGRPWIYVGSILLVFCSFGWSFGRKGGEA